MTVIYPSPIFGPIHSRRLGVSLGINLMPGDGKLCSFDCIYCGFGLYICAVENNDAYFSEFNREDKVGPFQQGADAPA